ncbi:hypothetical protein [Flavobacterium sp.]|uniref:hypothetical protein n=1 Tax=Flavobacterium sp. TaxID=239 RepID=UPI0025EB9235|nr:hypothetical protein [Flavobacterium sp.]
MNFRIAKKSDISRISNIHYECSVKQVDGFMHKLGVNFLEAYYSILINEKKSFILVAEDNNGVIAGFHSGSIEPMEHKKALRKKACKFVLPILIKLITNPTLLSQVILRQKSLTSSNDKYKFSSNEGPRAEYWAWSPSYDGKNESLKLREKWSQILNVLGYDYYYLEVDSNNKLVLNYYKLLSAEFISELNLSDGRKRFIVKLKTNKN